MKSKLISRLAIFLMGISLLVSSCNRTKNEVDSKHRGATNSSEKSNRNYSGNTNSDAPNGSPRIETTKTAAVPTSREAADSSWRKK